MVRYVLLCPLPAAAAQQGIYDLQALAWSHILVTFAAPAAAGAVTVTVSAGFVGLPQRTDRQDYRSCKTCNDNELSHH